MLTRPTCLGHCMQVIDDSGRGAISWVIAGIDDAIHDGVDIINLSLGVRGQPPPFRNPYYDALMNAGERYVCTHRGTSTSTVETCGQFCIMLAQSNTAFRLERLAIDCSGRVHYFPPCAAHAGIFVAQSAGNDGPGLGSIGDATAPWTTSVAASTIDR